MNRLHLLVFLVIIGLSSPAQSINVQPFGTDSTFDVMTWNIETFPKNGQITVEYVTHIIESLDVDLLAIQEVNNISAFEQLIDSLDSFEGYFESDWFAGLAYVYKPGVIQINDIYEIYTTAPYWSPFPRSPMVLDLNYMNERIIVINNHLKCCGDGFLNLNDPDDEETRRYYASNLLKGYIDINFPDEKAIILGDLNDNLTDDPENNVFQLILNDDEDYLFADIDIALGNESDWSYPNYPSHIDHILITNELFDEFEYEGSAIETIKLDEYISGGWDAYEQNISDHRPVALKLSMSANLNVNDYSIYSSYFNCYPNPFNSETTFSFKIPAGNGVLEISNIQGQLVYSKRIAKGETSMIWNTEGLPAGIYIAKLFSGNDDNFATLKLILRE